MTDHCEQPSALAAQLLHSLSDDDKLTLKSIHEDIKRQGFNPEDPAQLIKTTTIFVADELVCSLKVFSHLPKLRNLKLWDTKIGNEDLRDLTPLRELKSLELDGTRISQLDNLSTITSLERVSLNDTEVEDLSPLSNLLNLRRLDLSGCKRLQGIGPLKACCRLEQLCIDETNITDLSPLENLSALELLVLPPELDDSTTLKRLQSLRPNLDIRY